MASIELLRKAWRFKLSKYDVEEILEEVPEATEKDFEEFLDKELEERLFPEEFLEFLEDVAEGAYWRLEIDKDKLKYVYFGSDIVNMELPLPTSGYADCIDAIGDFIKKYVNIEPEVEKYLLANNIINPSEEDRLKYKQHIELAFGEMVVIHYRIMQTIYSKDEQE